MAGIGLGYAESDEGIIAASVVGVIVLISLIVFCCKPRNCTICLMNIVRFCYEWSCCRLDCASKLNPNVAILRYEEDPPLDREDFIHEVISNNYIKSILNTFAILLPEYFLSILPSGSLREGFGKILPSTAVLASDFDVMLVPDAAMAGQEGEFYAENEKPLFAVVESTEISPGFVWLRLENEYLQQWEKLCIRRHTKGRGCSYLSSHKVHGLIRETFEASQDLIHTNKMVLGKSGAAKTVVEQNGPALTVKIVMKTFQTCGMKCKCCTCCERERDDIIFYCDFTFALHCPHWPKKSDWFSEGRRRNWPQGHVVKTVKEIGCHVVPKPSTDNVVKLHTDQPLSTTFSQSPGLEWRYSFSQPELLLSMEIPKEAKSAFLALKAVNKRYISQGFIKALPSYIMKCVLYQMMEETDATYWEHDPEPCDIFLKLIDILSQHLNNGSFPHYWIRSINLLQDLDVFTIQTLLHKVNTVRHKPQAFIADNWLELTRCLRQSCCACCAFGKQQRLTSAMFSNILATKDSKCPCFLVPCSYGEHVCCLGPCPYDKLNMDVY